MARKTFWLALLCVALTGGNAAAQDTVMPQLFGDTVRTEKPELTNRRVVRFLTSADFAPFQFATGNDDLAGFNVDLARAVCAELDTACTLQAWASDDLLTPLVSGRVDAVIAGMKPTPALLQKVDVSRVYFRIPARFAAAKGNTADQATAASLSGKTIGTVTASAHEAFIKAFFPGSAVHAFDNPDQLLEALAAGSIDHAFADGVKLASWLNTPAGECCALTGKAYYESHFFGEGMVIAVRKGDRNLAEALNDALGTLEARGTLTDLYLRWFPIGLY
jgi:polar amino acid transport system substrate-binding protein